uniref:Uncharacterized protein n=1 Tax=Eutreptiella gymnastica TaxID=73025 RepID=A0A7S4LI14_9EUGL
MPPEHKPHSHPQRSPTNTVWEPNALTCHRLASSGVPQFVAGEIECEGPQHRKMFERGKGGNVPTSRGNPSEAEGQRVQMGCRCRATSGSAGSAKRYQLDEEQ